jgi:hypothetical protein
VDSPRLAALVDPLFAFGGKRVRRKFPLCCAKRDVERSDYSPKDSYGG